MPASLEHLAHTHDNDYTALEVAYRAATGGELVGDPFGAVRYGPASLNLTASVVIPAWNARDTLVHCLAAIEHSSFNRKYPERLEVVVVDDGSTDGTWELLHQLPLNLRLKAVQQAHHSRAHTQNTGIAVAEGDVIIACDADMILTSFAIEELVKRHAVLENVMLIGFRGDIAPNDARLTDLPAHLPHMLAPFERDVRVAYGAGGRPESMCRDSGHLRQIGLGRSMLMADGSRWDLPGIVYGCLFSLRRADFAAMDGYDERFYGWGCEDTLVGVRARALGYYFIPVYAAAGWHIAHGDRSARKWREFAANRRTFQAILRAPFARGETRRLANAPSRVRCHLERSPKGACAADDAGLYDALDDALADPDRRGKILYHLGRYAEAADAFADVRGTPEEQAWAMFDRGKALRAAGQPANAMQLLEEVAARLPNSPWPHIELGLALASQGQFVPARQRLEQAWRLDPPNSAVASLLQRSAQRHLSRAAHYQRQEQYALALGDCEAALILDPRNTSAHIRRSEALERLGEPNVAESSLTNCLTAQLRLSSHTAPVRLALARLRSAVGDYGTAKVLLEQARRAQPRNAEVAARLAQVHAAAAAAEPLPLARPLIQRVRDIPGWLGDDEAELLVALVWRAVARCDAAAVLVEIGSYCGRATTLMALAAQSLGRMDARVVALDEPSLGPAPDGRGPRQALHANLAAYGVADLVACAPEDTPAPWEAGCDLVLVDGRHDYTSVESDVKHFAPYLHPGGLLAFHDYADYFPDVQRYVDELLLGGAFAFVAQAGSLIALVRRVNKHEPD